MAEVAGLSKATISRIWRTFGLQSHRVDTFKLSADPQFVEKVRDIVGLYLSPPDHALVLSVDEKSQVQALGRSRPLLPMRPGIAARQTHDYIRHGTTSLFAALDVATGKVIGQCHRRHRHQELLKFLQQLDTHVPPTGEIHIIMDNYGTHRAPKVARWFARHPRYHVHFTPTSSLNQVSASAQIALVMHCFMECVSAYVCSYPRSHHRQDVARITEPSAVEPAVAGRPAERGHPGAVRYCARRYAYGRLLLSTRTSPQS